jgi:hypothetical protein
VGSRETYRKVVIQACVICGDETSLARELRAPVAKVVDWLLGDRAVTNEYFLKAVDIVLASTRQRLRDNEGLLEEVRRRRLRRKQRRK